MKKLILLSVLALGAMNAALIPSLDVASGGVICGPGTGGVTCTYSYVVTLNSDSELNTTTGNAQYFTIYDFNGFTGLLSAPVGWVGSSAAVGITPSNIIASFDNAGIPNLTFTYTGAPIIPGGGTIGTFTAESIYGPSLVLGRFSSQATHFPVSPGGSYVQATGYTDVPNPNDTPDDTIPEPMTMGLIGSGLLALGVLRSRRK